MSEYGRCNVCDRDINTEYHNLYLEECGHSTCDICHSRSSDSGRCENCMHDFIAAFFEENASSILKETIKERSLHYHVFLIMYKFHRVDL